ncbi:MAG: type III-A CRISPR-associated protein Csm2 [Cardiobacteriaceae bacterium]|nr:type III-A CRISPR-associated protein Csm2 [Cardiobacteriaceae bacterium]
MDLQKITLKDIDRNPAIFSDIAEEAAKYIHPHQKRDRQGRLQHDRDGNPIYESHNKSTQLRKFYDELAMWDSKIHRPLNQESRQAEYDKAAPFIHMLKAKVAYAKSREHVNEDFCKIFNRLITQINDPGTLHHAKLFFEAMLGFRKAAESK